MSTEAITGGYGYEEGQKESSLSFGLNTGNVKMTKFEYTQNGGKGGSELEAVDIVFNINGTEKSYRQFPVSKAKDFDNNVEITDPSHPKFIEAQKELSARLTHIVGAFVPKEDIQSALSSPVKSFKEYIKILSSLLPKDYSETNLDIFLGYQWQISDTANKTYLEIPKKMTSGKWLCVSVPCTGGIWKEERKSLSSVGDSETALRYYDSTGNIHPFTRNGWYLKSNYSIQQSEISTEESTTAMNETAGERKNW